MRNSNNINDETIIRWGSTSKPAFGGISFYILFLFSFIVAAFKHNLIDTQVLGILVSVSLGFMIGLADDAYNTKPLLKFLGQVLCAVILVVTGTQIKLFENDLVNIFLTIFWVIGMMNSINMLDNMDAITTSVSIFVFLTTLFLFVINGDFNNVFFIICLGQVAALLGFLYFNWNPSRMYMGDTGSMFLGVLLAAVGILFFWNAVGPDGAPLEFSRRVLAAVTVFLLPIADTTTVTINRLLKKQSPFVGGKDHTTHHLSYAGLSDREVALVFCVISMISTFLSIYIIRFVKVWGPQSIALFGAYCVTIFSILYYLTRIKRPPKENK
ncbi:MAG: MraY family glycosyltransferase [Bacteroidetes bacterium]|nr:MraY family glycosyltransferase [Bacteroidota bacterium]